MPKKKKGYKIRYATSSGHGIIVELPCDPRKHECDACGKSVERGEIRSTALHHWRYKYHPKTVKANPMLAIENTNELCFYCHQIADAIRALFTDKAPKAERILAVISLLSDDEKKKLIRLFAQIVKLEGDLAKETKVNGENVVKILELVLKK